MTRFITWSVRPENGLFMKSKVTARNLVDYLVYTYRTGEELKILKSHVKIMPTLFCPYFLIKGKQIR